MIFRPLILLLFITFKAHAYGGYNECIEMFNMANTHYYLSVNAARNTSYQFETIEDEECSEIMRSQLASLAEALERYEFYSMSAKVIAINIQSAYLKNICSLDLATKAGYIIERINKLRLRNAVLVRDAKMAINCSELFE